MIAEGCEDVLNGRHGTTSRAATHRAYRFFRAPSQCCGGARFFSCYNCFVYLKSIELAGFKSFGKKSELVFTSAIAGIVGLSLLAYVCVPMTFELQCGSWAMAAGIGVLSRLQWKYNKKYI